MTALKVREVEGRNRIMVWKDVTCVGFYTRRCSSVEQVARTLHKQGADADQKRYISLFSFTCYLMVSQVIMPAITVRGFDLLAEAYIYQSHNRHFIDVWVRN